MTEKVLLTIILVVLMLTLTTGIVFESAIKQAHTEEMTRMCLQYKALKEPPLLGPPIPKCNKDTWARITEGCDL
jgi:hypothetical protein